MYRLYNLGSFFVIIYNFVWTQHRCLDYRGFSLDSGNSCKVVVVYLLYLTYGKYPKNSNTKTSDKMTYTNSVDPDQTAPEGAV